MIDDVLISQKIQYGHNSDPSVLYEVGLLFGKSSRDLWTEYRESRPLTVVHDALLGTSDHSARLDTCLTSLAAVCGIMGISSSS